jgi:hypothetical protein
MLARTRVTGSNHHDPENGTYTTEFEWGEPESLPMTIVEAVAEVRDVDETELERLTDRIEPDALDRLFAPKDGATSRLRGSVTFPFAGTDVTVYAHGEIVIRYDG